MLHRIGVSSISLLLAGCLVTSFAYPCLADNLALSGGVYSLAAKVQGREIKIAGPGSYAITWFRPLLDRIDLMFGYSLMMSEIIGGDMGYGPDIGFAWYPISRSEPIESRSENVTLRIDEQWRPFVSGQFIQRQFQSVQSSYSGFHLSAGTFYRWNDGYSLMGQFRFGALSGPNGATATETNLLFGISLGL